MADSRLDGLTEDEIVVLSKGSRFGERLDPDDPRFRLIELRVPLPSGVNELVDKHREAMPFVVKGNAQHVGFSISTMSLAFLHGAGLIPDHVARGLIELCYQAYSIDLVDGVPVDVKTKQPIRAKIDG